MLSMRKKGCAGIEDLALSSFDGGMLNSIDRRGLEAEDTKALRWAEGEPVAGGFGRRRRDEGEIESEAKTPSLLAVKACAVLEGGKVTGAVGKVEEEEAIQVCPTTFTRRRVPV